MDAREGGDADEGDFIQLLIASERVDGWLEGIKQHSNDLHRYLVATSTLAQQFTAHRAGPRPSAEPPPSAGCGSWWGSSLLRCRTRRRMQKRCVASYSEVA
jgi:hypothetical protein